MSGLLLRLYPAGWRARYGEELQALVLESSGRQVPWKVRVDVVAAAGREWLRDLAGGGQSPERVQAGALLVLRAWALFVVAGLGVQKASEHWQNVTPPGSRGLPTVAFDALVVAAAAGSVLVLAGIALTLPSLARFLRSGGWPLIRVPIAFALSTTVVLVPSTAALSVWAHALSTEQRNGHDHLYAGLFLAWLLLALVCLAAWTAAAVATARRLELSAFVLRLETRLAALVAAAMVVMTMAATAWWATLAQAAPWFFAGRPAGATASPVTPQLLAATALMLLASMVAAGGAIRAQRTLKDAHL
jgi:hypothetical protein